MKKRCIQCPCICKQLDVHEHPVTYEFLNLGSQDILSTTEDVLGKCRYFGLEVEQYAQSPAGNQFVLILRPKPNQGFPAESELPIIVVAEAGPNNNTQLYLNYSVPNAFCNNVPMMMELTERIRTLVALLTSMDNQKPISAMPPHPSTNESSLQTN